MSKRLGLAAVLVVIAMLAVACGGGGGSQQSGSSTTTPSGTGSGITVSLRDFRFEPATITVQRGAQVTISLKNDGAVAHDFAIEALGVKSDLLRPSQTGTVTFTAPNSPGQYQIICTEPGHLASGMSATLVVQ